MKIVDRIQGIVLVQIHAAFPETILNACALQGLALWDMERIDACTLQFRIHEKELTEWETLASRCQAELQILERSGGSQSRKNLKRRIALLLSLLLAAVLLVWCNLHIWEIEVRGCEGLTRGQVLRALEDCGVTEGTWWPGLSPETIRGQMLIKLPELAWMTVNVSGSRAVVSLVERTDKPEIYRESDAADIVASNTGILYELTVLNGHPLVSRGSAVVKGDTLVTGAMDSLSHPTRYVRAQAKILADTWYEWIAVEPSVKVMKGETLHVSRRFAIKIGKNRVNLFQGSRKELDGYDKIVHEYRVGVEGLFALPVSLIREEYRMRESLAVAETEPPSPNERLQQLLEEQIEGEILQAKNSVSRKDDCIYTTLRAHCRENIAQTAEILPP